MPHTEANVLTNSSFENQKKRNESYGPIPFITFDEQVETAVVTDASSLTKKNFSIPFIVNPEACKILDSVSTPICVIAIAGLYRTGKSFILNVCSEIPILYIEITHSSKLLRP
jgi:Guanylate-binding protein, N-terminal domain